MIGSAEREAIPRAESRGGAPLRLAVFSYGLPVEGEKRGGCDRVAHDLAHGLAQRGHEVTIWSYDPRPAGAAYRVRRLPWNRLFRSRFGNALMFGYLGNLLALTPDYRGADAVIAMGDSILLPLRGKPIIRVMLGSALGEALSAKTPLRFVHQLGVYVQELLTALTQAGCVGISENTRRFNPLVRRVIPIGTDLTAFAPDASAKTEGPSILFVGSLDGRKRGRLLLDWFARQVRPRCPTARLMMVAAPGPAVEGVSYHPGVGPAELVRLYQSAWVYASPSIYEGLGLPYLEAMASGTPVVASPNPGSTEVLGGGKYGVLASDAEFGELLIHLLQHPAERERLTERGVERVADYALSRTIDAYESLLLERCRPGKKSARK